MKPICLYIFAFLFTFYIGVSKIFGGNPPDTNSIISLNQKAWELRNQDKELSKQLAFEAIRKANAIKYLRGLSFSYNVLGHFFKVKGENDSSWNYYTQSFLIRERLKDTINMARSLRNIMSIEKVWGKNKNAITTGLRGIKLLSTQNNDESDKVTAWFKINLAPIYQKTGDFLTAITFANEAKTYFNKSNDKEGEYGAATTLGNCYKNQKQFQKALNEFNYSADGYNALNNQRELAKAYNNIGSVQYYLGKYVDAHTYYNKALVIRKKNEFTSDIPGSFQNLGILYEAIGKSDSALWFYNQSLSISSENEDEEGQYEAHRSLGTILSSRKEYRKALGHLEKSYKMSLEASDVAEQIVLLKEISSAYSSIGKPDSALAYTNQYSRLNDSINEILRESIEVSANLKEKEYEIELITETNKRQMVIIIGISCALFLIVIIFWLYSRSVKAKKRELQLKQIIKEKELFAMDAELLGQEEERRRLGIELHDTIGSILSAAKYAYKAMGDSIDKLREENNVQYQKINKMLDEALESVRRISHNMIEGIITEKGLTGALMELCDSLSSSDGVQFKLEMHGFDRKFEYVIESNLYRIVQELMTNVLRHSGATEVNIQFLKSKGNINLVFEDNGKGFNPDSNKLKKGIGLDNIEGRIKKLSGKWSIDSGKGMGTTVIIDVPVNENSI